MKKIAMVLTNAFNPDIRVYKEARYFVEQGHEVTVYAWDKRCECKKYEEIDGIKVQRIQIKSITGGRAKQIIPSIKFMNQLKKILNKATYDILYCHDLDGAIAGYFANRRKNIFVFDMHEVYDGYFYYDIPLLGKELFRKLIDYSNYIIYVNEEQIVEFSQMIKDKCIYLPNFPIKNMFEPIEKIKSDKFRINYIGGARDYISLDTLLSLNNEYIEVCVYGYGTAYDRLKENKYANNARLAGKYNGITDSGIIYQNTDILYCVYDSKVRNWQMAYPVKLFEAIVTRTPIIACKGTNLEKFVNKYGIGMAVEYGNREELLECIFKMKEKYSSYIKNIKEIENDYSWENIVLNLNKLIEKQ